MTGHRVIGRLPDRPEPDRGLALSSFPERCTSLSPVKALMLTAVFRVDLSSGHRSVHLVPVNS
jgi:hypothetical protein